MHSVVEPLNDSSNSAPVWPLDDSNPLLAYLQTVLRDRPRGLCTDIDGTISDTAPTVDAAVLSPGMRDMLATLMMRFDLVATISGRAVLDQRRLIDVPGIWHVGHHGYEWEEDDEHTGARKPIVLSEAAVYASDIAQALDEIETELAPLVQGLWMERKGITGGVHWRLAPDTREAERICRPVIRRIARAYGLRVRGGKLAMELFPPVITHKGEGLKRLIEQHHLETVIYLGDDISDTDAFKTLRDLRAKGVCNGVAIGVMHKDAPITLPASADLVTIGTSGVMDILIWLSEVLLQH